jgi:hypothetical protein
MNNIELIQKVQKIINALNSGYHNITEDVFSGQYVSSISGFLNRLGWDKLATGLIYVDLVAIIQEFPILYIIKIDGKWSISGERWNGAGKCIVSFNSEGLQ